jgi:hypothetical protein
MSSFALFILLAAICLSTYACFHQHLSLSRKQVSGTCRIPYVSTYISPDRDAFSPTLQQTVKKAAETVLWTIPMLDLHVVYTIEHALFRYPVPSDLNAWYSDCVISVQLAVGNHDTAVMNCQVLYCITSCGQFFFYR